MSIPRFDVRMLSVGVMVLGIGTVCSGQDYPTKPIRLVTTPVGAGPDFLSRLVAQGLVANPGWQVIVDNRPAGVSPGETVSQAPADGYALLVTGPPFWILPLMQKVSYDPVQDFSPITLAANAPNILVVHPSVPTKSVKDLIALAKARPGELNYATGAGGSPNHIAGELFKSMAGINMVRIPYKGGGPALIDLIGGQVQLMFATGTSVTPHVKSGRLRALAVTSLQPSTLAPGLPTVASSGLPGYEAVAPIGIFSLAKTPDATIRRLNREIVRVLNQSDVKQKLFDTGTEAVGSSPEQFATYINTDRSVTGKLIKEVGIRAN